MLLYKNAQDYTKEHLEKLEEPLTIEEKEELNLLQNKLTEIAVEYRNKIDEFFFKTKTAQTSSILFEKINDTTLKKFQEVRKTIISEKNQVYFETFLKGNIIFREYFRQELNNFYLSPFASYLIEIYKNEPIQKCIYINEQFKLQLKEKKISKAEIYAELQKLIVKNKIADLETKILEKCSCYQNNIINYLPKVIGIKRKKITNKEFPKTETEQTKPRRGRKKKEIEEIFSIREEENRIIYEVSISKTEKFILSIDENKTITPAMLRTFIYILSIATPHIKTYSKIGNIIEMQEIKINLKKASYDLKINKKDWLKKHIIKTLDSFITVKAKSNYFDDEKSKKTKTERYILFDDYLLQDYKIKENEIIVTFNKLFTISLMKSEEMIIPMELFRIDLNKYPLAFLIGYYLLLHERRNQKNTAKINKDYIKVKIETLLFNSGRDINEAIKTNNTKKEKELSINSLQILKDKGILKDYKYKLNNKEYEANEIEDNKTFSEWREYTLCYKFSDMITEKLNEYNKRPQIRKSKTK